MGNIIDQYHGDIQEEALKMVQIKTGRKNSAKYTTENRIDTKPNKQFRKIIRYCINFKEKKKRKEISPVDVQHEDIY